MKSPNWQDLVFGMGGIVLDLIIFCILLNPTSLIPIGTSVVTAIVLASFSYCQLTLNLKLASITSLIAGLEWVLVAFLRH